VAFGLASTLADMSTMDSESVIPFEQVAVLGSLGSIIGLILAQKVGPTELPQTVAAFHSLVGLAAMAGAAGEYLSNTGNIDTGTLTAIYLATFVGGITATGSMVAFGKLSNFISVR
jgi:NAD(P) transhydrogenase